MERNIKETREIEDFIAKNDLLDETSSLKQEFSIKSSRELEDLMKKNRLLKIGIIGRVKAGKSSFLNALVFDGKNILPKAATPMTAALTILQYSQSFGAEVDFYTQEDLDEIKNGHSRYQKRTEEIRQRLLNEKRDRNKDGTQVQIDENEDAKIARQIKRELEEDQELTSFYEQWEKIRASNIDFGSLESQKDFQSSSIDDLQNQLKDFVGSDGKWMPFSKSVTLKLDYQNLEDLQIVDSPGINDPIVSREQRTRALLKDCDVVFLISPSGQFLSHQDMDLLDRVIIKEGIQEIYVVASQADQQLFGDIYDKSQGNFPSAISLLEQTLNRYMTNTIQEQIHKSQESGDDNFSKLLEKLIENPVICISGIAYSLAKKFDNQTLWDESEKHAWENLSKEYQDYFESPELAKNNLLKLANIDIFSQKLKEIRGKKDDIQREREEARIATMTENLNKYRQEILKLLKEKQTKLQESDIESLKKEQARLNGIKEQGKETSDLEFKELICQLKIELGNNLKNKLKEFFKKLRGDIEDNQSEEAQRTEVSTSKWYNPFTWGTSKIEIDYITQVRAGFIYNQLQETIDGIEQLLTDKYEEVFQKWKKTVQSGLIKALRGEVGDEDLDEQILRRVLSSVAESFCSPKLKRAPIPSNLRKSGTLRGYDAERFVDDVYEFTNGLQEKMDSIAQESITTLVQRLKAKKIGDEIFGKYDKELSRLGKEIENKQSTLEHYAELIAQLEQLINVAKMGNNPIN